MDKTNNNEKHSGLQ